jgi:hypothetical protein
MNISYVELYKIIGNNKSLFSNINIEITNFVYHIGSASCAGACGYRKVEVSFRKLIDRNRTEIENVCFLIFKRKVYIV